MQLCYLRAALRQAKYEILADDATNHGEVPGFQGAYAKEALSAC